MRKGVIVACILVWFTALVITLAVHFKSTNGSSRQQASMSFGVEQSVMA